MSLDEFSHASAPIWDLEMHFRGEKGARRVEGSTKGTTYHSSCFRETVGQDFRCRTHGMAVTSAVSLQALVLMPRTTCG